MSNNKIELQLNVKSDDAVNNLEKVDKSFKKINKDFDGFGKRTKKEIETGLAALKALRDATVNVEKETRKEIVSIDTLFKSFKKITPVIAIGTASFKALSTVVSLSATHSEAFSNSLDRIKTAGIEAIAPTFKNIGDSLAGIVGKVNEWVEAQSRLNGTIAITNQKQLEAIKNAGKNAEENAERELKALQELGATADEINGRRLNGLRNLQNITEQTYNDAIALQEKYKKDLKEINALLVDLKEKKDNVNIMDLDAMGNNPYEEQFKKAMDTHARLVSQASELDNKILPSIREKYKENAQEIQKNTTSTKQTTKVEKDRLQQLREQLAQVKKIRGYENDLNDDNLDNEDEKQRYYERQLQSLNQQKSIVNAIYNEERSRGIVNEETKKQYEELERLIEEIQKKLKDTDEKAKITWQQWANEGIQAFSQLNNLGQSIASLTLNLIDTSVYDKQINEAQAKITAFNQWKEEQKEEENEQSDEEYEAYLERLDKEYEIAKKVGDKMTMLAIENKKKELAKNKEKLEEDKQITEQEKALEKELAIAEYNKSYAEWQNECAIAEQNKQMNLAQAFIQPLQAAANAALGIAQSFAKFGLPGVALGTAASIGVIASAVSSASAYKSSAQQLDSVKNSPPTPPAFQFGTTGYQLDNGQSAIVGETGAEVIRNMAGKLVVESNAQAKAMGRFNEAGMYIEQVIFNVSSIVDKKTIYKAMNEYKQRDSFAYTR